jgi:hypothetical protein
MLQLIVAIILLISLIGLVVIIIRKLPVLVVLPQIGSASVKDFKFVEIIRDLVKSKMVIFEKKIFVQKFLSWVKVMTLKIETKVDKMLHGIRKKSQQ